MLALSQAEMVSGSAGVCMIIVPFYVELASDDQWNAVHVAIERQNVNFVTGEIMEGITLEEVEERVKEKT